jgi:hypothetical protein
MAAATCPVSKATSGRRPLRANDKSAAAIRHAATDETATSATASGEDSTGGTVLPLIASSPTSTIPRSAITASTRAIPMLPMCQTAPAWPDPLSPQLGPPQMTIGIRTVSAEGLFGCDELVYGLIHEYRIVAWAG